MTEFIRKYKDIQIGRAKIRIYRREVSLLFLLLEATYKTKSDILFALLVIPILKHFFKFRSLLYRLGFKKLQASEIKQLADEVIAFNLGNFQTKQETQQQDWVSIQRAFYYLITQVIFYTGWSMEYVMGLDYVSIRIIYENIRFYRWNQATDTAGAWDLKKYRQILGIRG